MLFVCRRDFTKLPWQLRSFTLVSTLLARKTSESPLYQASVVTNSGEQIGLWLQSLLGLLRDK